MAEPSMSSESLELPSSTDDLPFDCSNPMPSALLDDNLIPLSDTIAKDDSAPVGDWLADTGDERFGLASDQLISMSDDLIRDVRDEMMASSSSAAVHMDDDLDADSKSVFTVHEMGTLHASDVIGSTEFDLVDTIIQGGMQVDPTVIGKPFVEPVDSQSNLTSTTSDSRSTSPQPTVPAVQRRRGRKPKSLLQQETAAAPASQASSSKPNRSQAADRAASVAGSSLGKGSGAAAVPTGSGVGDRKRTGTPVDSGNGRPASDRTPSTRNPVACTPSAGTPAACTPSVGTPSAGASSGGTSSSRPTSAGNQSAGTPSTSGQPRRSVRICEQDPRDFLQELRQGHYLKPRMTSSPNKTVQGRRSGEPKVGDPAVHADGSPAAAADDKVKVRPSSETPNSVTESAVVLLPHEQSSNPTTGKKRKEGGGCSVIEQDSITKGRPAKKKKQSTIEADPSHDSDSSSSDDPDSVPLMQIKQKLTGSCASPLAVTDPDSVPLVQIKRSLQEAESGTAGKPVPPIKRKVGRPPKNVQTSGGPLQPKQKKPNEDATAARPGTTAGSSTGATAGGNSSTSLLPASSAASSNRAEPKVAEPLKMKKKKKTTEGEGNQKQQGLRLEPASPKLERASVASSAAASDTERGPVPAMADPVTTGTTSVSDAAANRPVVKTIPQSKRSNPVVALGKQVANGGNSKVLTDKIKADKSNVSTDHAKDKLKPVAAAEAPVSTRPSPSPAVATAASASSSTSANTVSLKRKAASADDASSGWSPSAKAVKVTSTRTASSSSDSWNDSGTAKQESKTKEKGKKGASPTPGTRTVAKLPASREGQQQEHGRGSKGISRSSSDSTTAGGSADGKGKPGSDGGDDVDELSSGRFTFIDNVEEEGSDWDEENDPDRLWCICKRPHDNRFMICCDRCQEWYHGDCVGITKARGKQIEVNREEYICKTCKERENAGKPRTGTDSVRDDRAREREAKERNESSTAKGTAVKDGSRSPASAVGSQLGEIRKRPPAASKENPAARGEAGSRRKKRMFKKFKTKPPRRQCIASGCERLAESGAVYCGPGCIRRYAGDMLRLLESRHAELQRLKASLAKRAGVPVLPASAVVVIERHSGKVISGNQAPNRATLSEFLLKHPSFEVLQPGRQHKPSITASSVSTARFYQKDKRPKEGVGNASAADGAKPERKGSTSSAASLTSRQNSSSSTVSGAMASGAAAAEGPAPDPDTIRRNVRKTLREMLWNRVKEADDINVSESYVENIALAIETELFNLQHDTSARYKSKYRSLLFNIKDPKNKGLFRKIVKSRIRPDKLVHMSSDELASKELMQWRESEMKHELDKIKEVEELRSHEEEPRVLHISHKQEVELVNDDLSDLRQVILEEKPKDMDLDVTAKNVELDPAAGTEKTSESASASASATSAAGSAAAAPSADTTALHSSHLFDRNCKVCTGQQAPPSAAAAMPSKKAPKVERHVHLAKDEKRHVKVQLSAQPREVVDRVVARELRHLGRELEDMKRADAVLLQRVSAVSRSPPMEPTSTVESPRSQADQVTTNAASGRAASAQTRAAQAPPSPPSLWKGSLCAPEIVKFFAAAHALNGPVENVGADLPDALQVVGRINPDQIWSYLAQLKLSTSKDVIVLSLTPLTDDEQSGYAAYYKYLASRGRCGVVGNAAETIKDMYIIPLALEEGIPPQLAQYCGDNVQPGFSSLKSHSLISIIVRSKSKKSVPDPVGRVKKVVDHRKTVTFASSTPPGDTDAEAYEPYDPETPAVDYNWKPASAASLGSSTADPIVRAYAQPDPRKLTALDVPGASPYSPSQSDYNNEEAYDPADDLQPVLPPGQSPGSSAHRSTAAQGVPSSNDLAEYKRSIEALNKRIEAEQEALRAKARLLGVAALTDGTGSAAAAATSSLSPSAAALLLSPAAAATASGLPKALQDIMNSSTFAAAAAAAAAAVTATAATTAGDSRPTADVLGYLKQTLEQVKLPLRSSTAASAPGLSSAVADPRVGMRPSVAPADPRLPPRGTAAPATVINSGAAASGGSAMPYPAAATYNYATVPAATDVLAGPLAQAAVTAAAAGGSSSSSGAALAQSQPQQAYFGATAVPPVAVPTLPYSAGLSTGMMAHAHAQHYFTAATMQPMPTAAAAPAYQQAAETTIPGLGDGIDWSVAAGASGLGGGHSPYLLDERDYDERQPPAALVATTFAGSGDGRAATAHLPQPLPAAQHATEPTEPERQQPRDVEDYQDHDYRPRPPPAGTGALGGSTSDDHGDHDERQRVPGHALPLLCARPHSSGWLEERRECVVNSRWPGRSPPSPTVKAGCKARSVGCTSTVHSSQQHVESRPLVNSTLPSPTWC